MRTLFAILLLVCPGAVAATINAASLSWTDVSNAVATATTGDTVQLPVGTVGWNGTIKVIHKGITIRGMGTNIAGGTWITNLQSGDIDVGEECIFECYPTNSLLRITQISFDGNKTANLLYFYGTLGNYFRVDRCLLQHSLARAIACSGNMAGLVDLNWFRDNSKSLDAYGGPDETPAWGRAMHLGTTNMIVGERNYVLFDTWQPGSTGIVNSRGQGGEMAWRFCMVTNLINWGFFPWYDAHGNQLAVSGQTFAEPPGGTGSHRGTRAFELYNNTNHSISRPTKSDRITDIRGGTFLMFSNVWVGTKEADRKLYVREEDASGGFTSVFPGQDFHMLYYWTNNVLDGAMMVTNLDFGYPLTDPNFFFNGTNVFQNDLPAGYTPLTFPHPLATALDGIPSGPATAVAQDITAGTLTVP